MEAQQTKIILVAILHLDRNSYQVVLPWELALFLP